MGRLRFFLFPLFCVLCTAATVPASPSLQQPATGQHLRFTDDLNYQRLDRAIDQSLLYLRHHKGATVPVTGSLSWSTKDLISSLVFFKHLTASHPASDLLSLELNTYFNIYQAAGGAGRPRGTMLVTGYYQPVFQGSLVRTPPFLYPLYSIPENLVLRHGNGSNAVRAGRFQGNRFTNYWTRKEIETQGHARGNELVYLKDPFDAFLLHIQGSGLIRLPDGSLRGIHYAAKNDRPYSSIGKYMIKSGKIKSRDAGIVTIRTYLAEHPEEMQEILYQNKSFIFFRWADTHDAKGNLGRPLTAGRSIAVDQHCFPAGGLAFLTSRKPVFSKIKGVQWHSFSRFVLAQDTGSAIRGPGRVDLFWGTGKKAGAAAGEMKETGFLYFFLLKKKFL